MVTITGCSFMVTVQAPNAPCTRISSSRPVGHHGDTDSGRRRARATQAISTWAMISTPIAIAK